MSKFCGAPFCNHGCDNEKCLTVLSWMQASADSQGSSRQMVGEETPAAYVHPAQEATAIEQADGSCSGETFDPSIVRLLVVRGLAMQHMR